jgi:hypothetical protein
MKETTVSRVMAEMGRRGGKAGGPKGGKARMAALTAKQRKALARKAALARWKGTGTVASGTGKRA